MRSRGAKRLIALSLIGAHLLLALTGCDNSNTLDTSKDQAPKLPPAESMQVDLSYFHQTGAGKVVDVTVLTGRNFNNAVIRALVINTVVAAVLALPSLTLAAAASQNPQPQDDGKFHWVYTYQDSGITLKADLAGWIDVASQESVWEMRVSNSASQPPLEDFLWYVGRAALDRSSGYWEIYEITTPDTSNPVLRIDWTFAAANEVTVDITVVKQGVPENGDRVTYVVDKNQRTIRWLDKSRGATVEISWDVQTGAGYLIAPDFNNGEKACWDAQRNDVACPAS